MKNISKTTKEYNKIFIDFYHTGSSIELIVFNKDLTGSKDIPTELSVSDTLEKLRKILEEPIKFLKDPDYAYLAIEAIKDPSLEFLVETFSRYYKITKISSEEISNETYYEFLRDFRDYNGIS